MKVESRKSKIFSGFTLVELLLSIAVTMVIVVGLSSSMLVASRAMPDTDNPANAALAAGAAAEELASEIQYAISINNHSSTMIEFKVADRDGDEAPETIRYEWTGTIGDPLTRQYNNGSIVDILNDVQEFNLFYDRAPLSDEVTGDNESAETRLVCYDSDDYLSEYQICSCKWYGQYFLPTLPADAVSWKVTRIEFLACAESTPASKAGIQLRLPTEDNLPSDVILEQKELPEVTLLDTYLKQEFTFSNVSGLSPNQGLYLVITCLSGSYPARIRGQNKCVNKPNIMLACTTNYGDSWWTFNDDSLLFAVYGTVTTSGQPQIQNTYTLESVGITLRTGDNEQTTISAGIKTPDKPKVIQ
ncbi:MAG: prepilin-type N-terminal cleavage/methylation domain-containing protein [Sedimentisphaerales bacterium]|nr:prepilin-type N-terminal cleavage/methylation domain-containing protein [Sedimentisphaerales bacterium]